MKIQKSTIEYRFSLITILIGWFLLIILSITTCFMLFILFTEGFFAGHLFFGFILYLLIQEFIPNLFKFSSLYINKTPALILTNNKLFDNVNGQIFDWDEIERIDYIISKSNYISIKVKDPSKFVNTQRSYFKKLILKLNAKYFNGSFAIQPKMLKANRKELIQELNNFLKN